MLDYWRNADKTITLGLAEDSKYKFESEEFGQLVWVEVTEQDLVNLKEALKFLLEYKLDASSPK